MISYLFFSGKELEVSNFFSQINNNNNISVGYIVREKLLRISANRKWAVLVLSDTTGEIDKRFIINNKGALAINGPCSGVINNALNAQDIFDKLLIDGAESVFNDLGGAFNLASISLKYGLLGFSDFTGSYPVYQSYRNGVNFISNSVHILKYVLNPKLNLYSLGWLIGHSNIFDDELVWSGFHLIKPSYFYSARLGESEKGISRKFDNAIWPYTENQTQFKNPEDIDWHSLVEVAASNLKNFCSENNDVSLSLTGGKDSRLILSIALYAGLKDIISTFTKGPNESPEITCAQNIASVAGVKHKALHPIQRGDARKDGEKIWKMLIQSNTRYAGGICLWDGVTSNVSGVSYDITGFGGELYRGPGGHAKQFKNLDFVNDPNLLNRWRNYHQKMDPLEILTPEMKDFQVESFSKWLSENNNFRVDVLPEKFFIENRLTHWNGLLAQQVPGRIKLMPLLSAPIARETFSLKPEHRNAEMTHFNMMKVAAPELVELPFLNDMWSNLLVERYGVSDIQPFRAGASPRSIQSWQWDFVEQEKEKIEYYLKEAAVSTNISSIFDVKKVISFVKDGNYRNVVDVKTVISCLGVALTMLNITDYPSDKVS